MNPKLKKISDQVMVITGATSGIGLATAREAARRGARLMLVARDETSLRQLTSELNRQGTKAAYTVADVADEPALRRAADAAIAQFGGFDTWINNAGVSVYGRLEEVSEKDHRRLFETNFWGLVHGSLIAAEHLKRRGGALINLGSEASEHPLPLQGMYTASKHAVKGFTDSLRLELEEGRAPISVTLIKPTGIDTMFAVHAKNYLGVQPTLPPPVYAPEVVAEAILAAAERPQRDVFVGASAKLNSSAYALLPRVMDFLTERLMFAAQKTNRPARPRADNALFKAGSGGLREREGHAGMVLESSLYTKAETAPKAAKLLLVAAAIVAIIAIPATRRATA